MSDTMDRATELENRNICRICLSQEDDANFSDIFDSASLPMEILSIGSVEVIFKYCSSLQPSIDTKIFTSGFSKRRNASQNMRMLQDHPRQRLQVQANL